MSPPYRHSPNPRQSRVDASHEMFKQKWSPAKERWSHQKRVERAQNEAIDELMNLAGLEAVKAWILEIKETTDLYKLQGVDFEKERFNAIFQGNPGTGKTTVARIYAKFLNSVGLLSSASVVETSGAKLTVDGVLSIIEELLETGGGVLFVDEAYQLTAPHATDLARSALDVVLTEMENHIGRLVVIFAGYNKDMESLFEHNIGLHSRIPYQLQFQDLDDVDLWSILADKIRDKYKGKMTVAGGMRGLSMRILIRRLASRRGVSGFGNARDVENFLAVIAGRQAKRIMEEKRHGHHPDYFYFTQEDLIGPRPSYVLRSQAWADLQELVGLDAVKKSLTRMVDILETNYCRELKELPANNFSLHKIFLGSPGTGKTTVAHLYGQIVGQLGLLSNGEVVVKAPSDFIGRWIGASENKTRSILDATTGKVLIIDNAHMLNDDVRERGCPFKKAVINTLVAQIQGVPGENRCIILIGYEGPLKNLFQNSDPGLSRRFPMDQAVRFEDFDLQELDQILQLKMKRQDLNATPNALSAACEVLRRARLRPGYCNAAEVNSLLCLAVAQYEKRQENYSPWRRARRIFLEPEDFDNEHNRQVVAPLDLQTSLQGRVSDDIIKKLEKYVLVARSAQSRGIDVWKIVPTRFIFKGPQGTGKSTTAQSLARLFYNVGVLSSHDVIEYSASELIEIAPSHLQSEMKKAFGKVLLVYNAHRLMSAEYVHGILLKLEEYLLSPGYSTNMVVILAGDSTRMDDLLRARPLLESVFQEEFIFRSLSPNGCLSYMRRQLDSIGIAAPFLKDTSSVICKRLCKLFRLLSELPSWANAQDVEELVRRMMESVLLIDDRCSNVLQMHTERESDRSLSIGTLSSQQAESCLKEMLCSRRVRHIIYKPEGSDKSGEDLKSSKASPAEGAQNIGESTNGGGSTTTTSGTTASGGTTTSSCNVPSLSYEATEDGKQDAALPGEGSQDAATQHAEAEGKVSMIWKAAPDITKDGTDNMEDPDEQDIHLAFVQVPQRKRSFGDEEAPKRNGKRIKPYVFVRPEHMPEHVQNGKTGATKQHNYPAQPDTLIPLPEQAKRKYRDEIRAIFGR